MTLEEIGSRAKAVSRTLNNLGSREKNIGLEEAARALLEGEEEILAANQAAYEKAVAENAAALADNQAAKTAYEKAENWGHEQGPVRPPCFKSGPDPVHGRWPFKSSCLR